ncbi:MAG: hypothetical protein AYP45_15580 [Candidatus Brocadia carolinensis]|uniref:Uncharacterized protein n=1 Tax=Candidatus Brocadia carolinensis TaxID=1004156 RepID=A0A1V4AQ99_9BACT|nr:MAG: hypothetical protein AYP45_15580 [Candidatus Brocadia caroliniensis]
MLLLHKTDFLFLCSIIEYTDDCINKNPVRYDQRAYFSRSVSVRLSNRTIRVNIFLNLSRAMDILPGYFEKRDEVPFDSI